MKFKKSKQIVETVDDLINSASDNWSIDRVYVKTGPREYQRLVRISDEDSTALIFVTEDQFEKGEVSDNGEEK